MANLIAANRKAQFPDFANKQELAAEGTHFCIENVKLVQQKDGKERWYLRIRIVGPDGYSYQTLTFDRTADRDDMFQRMIDAGDFPQHNCWMEKRTFRGKTGMMQSMYDLNQEQGDTCPICGEGEALDNLSELDETPF